ncbi:pyrroloquinoline quinone precursor peptide PqqA [Streptomyces sp. NBC_01530]
MNETLLHALRTDQPAQERPETSDERVWRSPGYVVVETALEVTAYALGDR